MKNEKYCAAVASTSWLTDAAYPLRVHTVFLHFWNFELGQKFWLILLAELCGVALEAIAQAMGKHLGEVFTVEHDMEPLSDEPYWPITG